MAVFTSQRPRGERSYGELLREITHAFTELVRSEVALAKAEMSEKAARAGRHLASVAIGAGVAFAGGLALLAAVVNLVGWLIARVASAGLAVWLAPLLVGGVLAAVGYGMITKAVKALREESLAPEQTRQTLQENKEWLKEKVR
jgi:uncharacterized membrane protein YqjE